jgi:hypothetical protein
MIQVELTRSSLLTPHYHGRGVDESQNISFDDLCPKGEAEPKLWDDEGAEDIDLRFEPGLQSRRGFMLIPRGSSRTFSDLGTNGDQACSPKFEVPLVSMFEHSDDHATNTSTCVKT